MAHQLTMFDAGGPAGTGAYGNPMRPVVSNGVSTSDAAAESIAPHVNHLQAVVLDALRRRGAEGATQDELEVMTGLGGNTIRPRLTVELEPAGLVYREGDKRKTRSGRPAYVWRARGSVATQPES